MPIVQAILQGVSDGGLLEEHTFLPHPLRELIKQYNKIALNDDRLPAVTDRTTGVEFKEAIASLEPEQQIKLLYHYVVNVELSNAGITMTPVEPAPAPVVAVTTTSVAEPDKSPKLLRELTQEDRKQLRLFTAKVFVLMAVAGVVAMPLGGVLFMAINQGALSSTSPVWSNFFSTVVEIFRLIFSFHPRTS